jgi:membrane-associated protease RseP (regulator of RpoE activity)
MLARLPLARKSSLAPPGVGPLGVALDPYLGYEIAVTVIVAYGVIVYALYRAGYIGPDRALSLLGPALMIKTKRGRAALERWARFRRFWTAAADVGVALAAIAMAGIVILLVFDAALSFRLTPATAPSVTEALGLPGINPIIPVGYGIVALVVGIVLHELAHGVVARSQGIGVKTLGVLWCVVPVGAFVEQDDVEMLAASRRKRDRVAAAGVLANFGLTVVFFVALSVVVSSTVSPAANGVAVVQVESNTPAANASLAPGDIITSINGTATTTTALFESSLAATVAGQTVSLVYYVPSSGDFVSQSVTLAPSPTVRGRGFLGVAVSFLTPADLKTTLAWPLGSSAGPLTGALDWLLLPFATLEPVQGAVAGYYHLSGPLAGLGSEGFWILANSFYWLAWMNLLLGLSNALPLVPLDGGLLFRDFAASIAARFRRGWSAARLDEFGGRAAVASSLVVLVLLLWQFIVPRLL